VQWQVVYLYAGRLSSPPAPPGHHCTPVEHDLAGAASTRSAESEKRREGTLAAALSGMLHCSQWDVAAPRKKNKGKEKKKKKKKEKKKPLRGRWPPCSLGMLHCSQWDVAAPKKKGKREGKRQRKGSL